MKRLKSIPNADEGHFTKQDLDEWLDGLSAYVDEADHSERGGDALLLWMSAVECGEAKTDREAEMVRRGIRLGQYLAAFNRKQYHSAVAKETLNPRQPTVTNAQILQAVKELPTREQQAAKLGISIRQLQRRLSKIETGTT